VPYRILSLLEELRVTVAVLAACPWRKKSRGIQIQLDWNQQWDALAFLLRGCDFGFSWRRAFLPKTAA